MTSSRQERSRPIKRVTIRLTLDAEKGLLEQLSRELEGSKVSGDSLTMTFTAAEPQEAIEKVRRITDYLKKSASASKDFK